MPSFLAYLVMWTWPLVSIVICKKNDKLTAMALLVLVPFMLLPVNTHLDIPLFTPIEKTLLAGLVLYAAMYFMEKRIPRLPSDTISKVLLICLLLSPAFSVVSNPEDLFFGEFLPGMTLSGFLQLELDNVALFLAPFLVGYHYFNSEENQIIFLRILVIAGLIYCLPILFEVRMSPQLHLKLYGYYPHVFLQQIRSDGFRAMVFIGHGLLVAVFMTFVLLSAFFLNSEKKLPLQQHGKFVLIFLCMIVVFCKSMSALIYVCVFGGIALLLSKKLVLRCCVIAGIILLSYPAIRSEFIPTKLILEEVKKISEQRHGSLQYRLHNEELLLEHVSKKPFFGWAAHGRNLPVDPKTEQVSVPDGYWVIVIGSFGWFGYIAFFGLLTRPMFMTFKHYRNKTSEDIPNSVCCLVVLLTVNIVDFIPNASFTLLTPLFAGSIIGTMENIKLKEKRKKSIPAN